MKLMLIDGNSLTYRAFYALPTDMATASGQVTNAAFGFTSMLINLLRDHRPDAVAVAFDRPEPTFRHEAVPTYKAQREEAPDILRQQMGLVRQVIDSLAIPALEQAGVEADDVIATLATIARDRSDEVLVVTGDRDSYQLVEDPLVKVLYNKRGVSDYVLYDEAGIAEKTGVSPDRYVPYAALRGDPSDNLPGVPGVGEKTAAKLINTYDDLDGVFAHVDDQSPKLAENLGAHQGQVRSNAEVMVLRRDVGVGTDPAELTRGEPDLDEVKRLFDFLEFRTLWDRLSELLGTDVGAGASGVETLEAEVTRVDDAVAAVELVEGLARGEGPLAVAAGWPPTPRWDSDPTGLAMVVDPDAGEVAYLPGQVLADGPVAEGLGELVTGGRRPLVTHDAKLLVAWFTRLGWRDVHLGTDTALASYLLDPGDATYDLAALLGRYARRELPEDDAAPAGQLDLSEDGATDPARLVARRALGVAVLAPAILDALTAQGLRRLHDEIEVPLVAVLAHMEVVGVGVDRDRLRDLHDDLVARVDELAARIHEDAGEEFLINSTPQLRAVLFDKLGLTPQKRTKTGYSTDAQSLQRLLGEHPIIEHLLAYREVEKLRSTYGEGLLTEVAADGRIHATFNQTVARTGRLSSDAPNLHNIPVRTDTGRAFREAFVPEAGHRLLVADYNQIELRCIAHLAEDPGLIAAFTEGDDIHTETAARIFSVEPGEVDPAQRSRAKMVSYGLAYGMEAYGLAQRLGIQTEEAAGILDAYFEAFPSVRDYMDRTVAEARQRGYTETLFGRRRPIPELSASNHRIRQAGERQAMNAGIQGLAADIFKVALVRLDAAITDARLDTRLILQVHDEVILEVPGAELADAETLTVDVLVGSAELRVPLAVNVSVGDSWAAAKG